MDTGWCETKRKRFKVVDYIKTKFIIVNIIQEVNNLIV